MTDILPRLQEFWNEANQSNSVNHKLAVIAKYPDLKTIWKYIYDETGYVYGVTSANVLKKEAEFTDLDGYIWGETVEQLLDLLNSKKVTGYAAIKTVLAFIKQHSQYKALILEILDRNLKTRTDAKLINRVFPGCIPKFEVELCETFDPKMLESAIDFENQLWYASRKCDGNRLCVKVVGGRAIPLSRYGREVPSLSLISEAVLKLPVKDCVLDGEACLVGPNDEDDFQGIMKEIRKKDHVIRNPRFKMFNMIPLKVFESGVGAKPYSEHLAQLQQLMNGVQSPVLSVLEQVKVKDTKHLEELTQMAADRGWEGLILRRGDVSYQAGRSKNLLKIKAWQDAEYVVVDEEFNDMRVIDTATGKEVEEHLLAKVVIEHKGCKVEVGSGFTLAERRVSTMKGQTITVKYFAETKNEKGQYSLRFPILKAIHGKQREV